MYAPIETFLRGDRGCDPVWRVGQGKNLRLRIPEPHRRIPDVVGARNTPNGWETHVVEAKPKHGAGAAIQQALAQLGAIAVWSDFLYLALEQADWDGRSGPQRRHLQAEVERTGYGLLLVSDDATVQMLVQPSRNGHVERSRREELLTLLEVQVEKAALATSRLGTQAAIAAASSFAQTLECLDLIGKDWRAEFGGKDRSGSYHLVYDSAGEPGYVVIRTSFESSKPHVTVEGDPFGGYLEDGEPRVWLWRDIAQIGAIAMSKNPLLRGWCLYAYNPDTEAEWTQRIEDVDADRWRRDGFTAHVCIGYPLTFVGRRLEGVRKEFAGALVTARLKEGRLTAR
jgi:hypothetical protein